MTDPRAVWLLFLLGWAAFGLSVLLTALTNRSSR